MVWISSAPLSPSPGSSGRAKRSTLEPLRFYNRGMSIRSWFARRREQQHEDAVKRAEDEAVESAAERAHSQGDRWGEAADERVARRAGGANIGDIDRLGE